MCFSCAQHLPRARAGAAIIRRRCIGLPLRWRYRLAPFQTDPRITAQHSADGLPNQRIDTPSASDRDFICVACEADHMPSMDRLGRERLSEPGSHLSATDLRLLYEHRFLDQWGYQRVDST